MGLAALLSVVQAQGQRCANDRHQDGHLVPECMVLFLQSDALVPLQQRHVTVSHYTVEDIL